MQKLGVFITLFFTVNLAYAEDLSDMSSKELVKQLAGQERCSLELHTGYNPSGYELNFISVLEVDGSRVYFIETKLGYIHDISYVKNIVLDGDLVGNIGWSSEVRIQNLDLIETDLKRKVYLSFSVGVEGLDAIFFGDCLI